MVLEVELHTFAAAHADGALTIDVPERYEYVAGHMPGLQLIPLPACRAMLPSGEPVYVICASGNRHRPAAQFLIQRGGQLGRV